MKVGTKVSFTLKKQTGTGKVTEVRETARGPFYGVKKEDGSVVYCRAAQLSPA